MDAAAGPATQANFMRDRLDGLAGGLAVLIDELVHGVLVASAKGELMHANQAARAELARREVLGLHEGRLQTVDGRHEREWTQALAKAEAGRRSLVSLRCGARGRMSIAVVPLKADRPAAPAHVALILSRTSVCDPLMLCFFARTHGLTPAEDAPGGSSCGGRPCSWKWRCPPSAAMCAACAPRRSPMACGSSSDRSPCCRPWGQRACSIRCTRSAPLAHRRGRLLECS